MAVSNSNIKRRRDKVLFFLNGNPVFLSTNPGGESNPNPPLDKPNGETIK